MNLVYLFVSLKKSVIPGFVKNPAGGLTVSSIFFNNVTNSVIYSLLLFSILNSMLYSSCDCFVFLDVT